MALSQPRSGMPTGLEPYMRLMFAVGPEIKTTPGVTNNITTAVNSGLGGQLSGMVQAPDGSYRYEVPLTMYRSGITVKQSSIAGWQLDVTLEDPATIFSTALFSNPVLFEGGYVNIPQGKTASNAHNLMFAGLLKNVTVLFTDIGEIRTSMTATNSWSLMDVRSRTFTYGSLNKTPEKADSSGQLDPINLSRSSWLHQGMTAEEIIRNIAADYHLQEGDIRLPPNLASMVFDAKKMKLLVQKDETDWEFLQRLAREWNCDCWVGGPSSVGDINYKQMMQLRGVGSLNFVSNQYVFENPDALVQPTIFQYGSTGGEIAHPETVDFFSADTAMPIWQASLNVSPQMTYGGALYYWKPPTGDVDDNVSGLNTSDNTSMSADAWVKDLNRLFVDGDPTGQLTEAAKQYAQLGLGKQLEWSTVKQFYRHVRRPALISGQSPSTEDRYWIRKWILNFHTFGNVNLRVGKVYEVRGLGGYSGQWKMTQITHRLGDTYEIDCEMRR